MKKTNLLVCVCVGVWMSLAAGSLAAAQTPGNPGSGAEDIRDIRGPVEIPEPGGLEPWVLGAAAALVFALGIWWLVRLLWLRENTRILTAREEALAALESAGEWMDPDTSREYAIAVSDTVRKFIETRFRLPSTRQTSEEFLRSLAEQRGYGLGIYTPTLADFMTYCDLGKFGQWQLGRPVMDAMHASAVAVINAELSEPGAKTEVDGRSGERDFLDPVSPVPAGTRP